MRHVAFILFLLVSLAAGAQDMRSLFVNAPDSVFPLLPRSAREDCVDFLDAGMRARVTNRLDGKSQLLSLTPVYLKLRSSEYSTFEARLLPCGGDTVIAVVRSVCAEACDSRVSFYRRDWSPAPIAFEMPRVADFFAPTDSLSHYLSLCDIYLVKLTLSPTEETMVAEYTMPLYMNDSDAKAVQPLLRPVVYRWRGGVFVKE